MKLFIHSFSCEYEDGCFNSTTNGVYSIDVPDYITRTTLAHIIKDKENMTEHNFEAITLLSAPEAESISHKRIYPKPPIPIFLPSIPAHLQRSSEQMEIARHNVLTYKHSKLSEISDIDDNSHIWYYFRLRG